MSISIGDTLANRYVVKRSLAKDDDVLRFSAIDSQTNEEVEILTPSSSALIRPKQRENFVQTHATPQRSPAHLSCLHCAKDLTRPFAVYPANRATLKDIPALTPEQGKQLFQFLAPVVAQKTDLLEGLKPSSIVVLDDGSVRIRPLGIIPKPSKIAIQFHSHPERPADQLFSLAMLVYIKLFQAPKKRKQADFLQWINSPPDILFENPDADPELAQWLTSAIRGTPVASPPLEECLLDVSVPEPPTAPPRVSSSAVAHRQSSAKVDLKVPDWLIMVAPTNRDTVCRQLAAIADVHERELKKLFSNGHTVPLLGADDKASTEEMLKQFEEIDATFTIQSRRGGYTWPAMIGLFFVGAILSAMSTSVLGFLLAPVLFAVLFLSFSIWVARQLSDTKRKYTVLRKVGNPEDPQEQVRVAIQSARNRILRSDMPWLAKSDLMETLDELHLEHPTTEQAQDIVAAVMDIQPSKKEVAKDWKSDIQSKVDKLRRLSRSVE